MKRKRETSATKRLNKHRPWLPQEYPEPMAKQDLDSQIAKLSNNLKKLDRELRPLQSRYYKLREKFAGPFTVEMIAAKGAYDRVKRQRGRVMQKLRALRIRKKERAAKS